MITAWALSSWDPTHSHSKRQWQCRTVTGGCPGVRAESVAAEGILETVTTELDVEAWSGQGRTFQA